MSARPLNGVNIRLHYAVYTPIVRHVKVRNAANPYDPQWESYFEVREGVMITDNLKGKRMLRCLWREQRGRCPVCRQPITELTGWHNHHIVQRVMGGSDAASNRVLLHRNVTGAFTVKGCTWRSRAPRRAFRKA